MTTITNEFMLQMLSKTKSYSIVLLKPGPNRKMEGVEGIIWEHGRRNFELRADGKLSIVCPVANGTVLSGLYIFNSSFEETKEIIVGDPAVKAGIFEYEIYPCRSFPGDSLPA